MPSVEVASSRIPVKNYIDHNINVDADDAIYVDNCDAGTH